MKTGLFPRKLANWEEGWKHRPRDLPEMPTWLTRDRVGAKPRPRSKSIGVQMWPRDTTVGLRSRAVRLWGPWGVGTVLGLKLEHRWANMALLAPNLERVGFWDG